MRYAGWHPDTTPTVCVCESERERKREGGGGGREREREKRLCEHNSVHMCTHTCLSISFKEWIEFGDRVTLN